MDALRSTPQPLPFALANVIFAGSRTQGSNVEPAAFLLGCELYSMYMNEPAAMICSRCGSKVSHESPESAPLAGPSDDETHSHGALATDPTDTPTDNEAARGEGNPVPADPHPHGVNGIRVVFREDGSAVLEYSQPPAGEPLDEEPAAVAQVPRDPLPTPVGPTVVADEVSVPELTNEQPLAAALPPRIEWIAARNGRGSMTAFAVGAAVATSLLVFGHLVYRSLAPSVAARFAEELPAATTVERLASDRAAPRIQPEPAPTARLRPTTAAALVGGSASARGTRVAP